MHKTLAFLVEFQYYQRIWWYGMHQTELVFHSSKGLVDDRNPVYLVQSAEVGWIIFCPLLYFKQSQIISGSKGSQKPIKLIFIF